VYFVLFSHLTKGCDALNNRWGVIALKDDLFQSAMKRAPVVYFRLDFLYMFLEP
jgi:hypothetical protein